MAQHEQIDQASLQKTLNRLIWLNRESERGFETAAAHVKNRGMKVLLKTYAVERARFATQLEEAARQADVPLREGGPQATMRTALATVHRGWINIKAAMTIGRTSTERVVLTESLRAESRVALRAYTQAVQQSAPGPIAVVIEEQYNRIQAIRAHLLKMARRGPGRLLVQLYDDPATAAEATEQVRARGIESEQVHVQPVDEVMEVHDCECHKGRMLESISAGALSGLLFGLFFGVVISIGVWLGPFALTPSTFAVFVSSSAAIALGIGVIFGAVIGYGTAEDDTFLYQESIRRGDTLVMVETEEGQADEVQKILRTQHLKRDDQALAAA